MSLPIFQTLFIMLVMTTWIVAQSLMYQGFGHFLLAKKNNHSKKAGA